MNIVTIIVDLVTFIWDAVIEHAQNKGKADFDKLEQDILNLLAQEEGTTLQSSANVSTPQSGVIHKAV